MGDHIPNPVTSTEQSDETAQYTVPMQVGGIEKVLSTTFDVISPATGQTIHRCSGVSVEDVAQVVEAAQAAFSSWRDVLPSAKRDIFLKVADVIESRAAELSKYLEDETGGTKNWVGFNIKVSAELLRDIAGRIPTLDGSVPKLAEAGRSGMVWKEPYGVILGIAPWNAAYILGFRAVAYAIAAGNTAILKAPESSPRCSWAIADCFREAGLPAGVLNVIAHRPSDAAVVTRALIEHPAIKKINFTGSTAVGKIIAETAGRNLKPVILELGGKAPAIVWEDADLELAADECAKGAFLNSGQICMSTERVLVHHNVLEKFEEAYKASISKFFAGASVLINRVSVEKNKRLIKDAVGKGATILYDGEANTGDSAGTSMSPVVVQGVTSVMDIYQTESFGPTVSLIPIKTEEEALRIANDTEYGLSSSIYTKDLRFGLQMAARIEVGACHINAMTVHDEANLPHGGVKNSGYGRFGSIGLEEWVRSKTVTFDL